MYDFIPFILGIAAAILGLVMIISPKKSTKAENRDNPDEVSKTKRNGIVVIVCGIVVFAVGILRFVS